MEREGQACEVACFTEIVSFSSPLGFAAIWFEGFFGQKDEGVRDVVNMDV